MTRRLLPRRLDADVAAGGVTTAFGVFFTVSALNIPASTFARSAVQPEDLPIAVGVGLVLCGLALTAQGLRASRPRGAEHLPVEAEDPPPARPVPAADDEADALEAIPEPVERPRQLLVVAALLIGYLLAFEPIGFIAATFLFLLAGSSYLQPRRMPRNIVYALVLSVAVYLLFDVVLGIVLPAGILDWLL